MPFHIEILQVYRLRYFEGTNAYNITTKVHKVSCIKTNILSCECFHHFLITDIINLTITYSTDTALAHKYRHAHIQIWKQSYTHKTSVPHLHHSLEHVRMPLTLGQTSNKHYELPTCHSARRRMNKTDTHQKHIELATRKLSEPLCFDICAWNIHRERGLSTQDLDVWIWQIDNWFDLLWVSV